MCFQTCYLAHPAERKHERHIETTTEAAVWAKRSFGYVPGSDQEGGTLSRSAEQAANAYKQTRFPVPLSFYEQNPK